ncbi:class I SAM-dependent methyltransferase [Puniceicoccus vermicola]|uniref:Methyltransferase domain-containing protein n=1 Tax=Puniceicoccus vermicola TaxID=388746 RepID=A0A7X1AW80_9BACT|nr:methyltransferase domain-containing protein [Puniceicoccus vermicola]MBC2601136.1 methyltransferase domain-containing protein [Puniceicoccus vermicola]
MKTFYDFHLHWYPGYQIDRFGERLQEVTRNYSSVVGVVYDTELVDCWNDFLIATQFLPLKNVESSDSRFYGEMEEDGTRIVFYRGVQAVSEENVELLVIGEVPDTGPLEKMVSVALSIGSAVLLPWGFGKWRGKRGQLILREFRQSRPRLFPSDSANRPNRGGGKAFLAGVFAKLPGCYRLDGSDPLPMENDEIFSFTLGMEGPEPQDFPEDAASFAERLPQLASELKSVEGRRVGRESVSRQVRLRKNGLALQPPHIPTVPGTSDAGDIESATDRYARRFSGSVGMFFLDRQAELTLKLAELERFPKGEVLDIGGGHTQLAPHFLEKGCSVSIFASDDSCRKRPDRILGAWNYRFATGDLLHLPYPDNSFEVVTLFRLVPHETDWEALIEEAARVSRNTVILDYPDIRSFNVFSRMLFLVKKAVEKDTRDYELFTRKKIAAAMEEAGLRDLRWRPQFFLPMALYRMVGSGRFAKILESFFNTLGLTQLFGSPVIVGGRKKASE